MGRVCILIDGIGNSGGTDRVAANLSNSLVKHGYDVSILSLSSKEGFYQIDNKVNIKYGDEKLKRIKILWSFCRIIKKENYDDVIVISMGKLSLQAIFLLKLIGFKNNLICSDHVGLNNFPNYIRVMKVLAYKAASRVVVLTEYDKKILQIKYKVNNVKVIRNSSSYSIDNGDHKKEKIVLAIGRLEFQKNFSRLLKIWHKIDHDEWKLLIVGSGKERSSLLDEIKNKNLKNVEIIDATKKIDDLYKRSSILAMTSRYEGLPMVLIESKFFGVVPIAFDCNTGPKEIISNDGYLIPYESDDLFSEKLQLLISNESLIDEFSLLAKKNSSKYSPEEIIKDWVEVLS